MKNPEYSTSKRNAKKLLLKAGVAVATLGLASSAVACEPTPVDPTDTTTPTAPSGEGVRVLGDSLIWMTGWLFEQQLPGSKAQGERGQRIDQIQYLVDDAIEAGYPYLFYNAGTNDAMQDLDPEPQFNVLINSLENSAMKCVVLATVNEATADRATNYQGTPEQYDPYSAITLNDLIRATVSAKNQDDTGPYYAIADWNAAVSAPGGELLLSDDGIHQSQTGVTETVNLFIDAFQTCPGPIVTVSG